MLQSCKPDPLSNLSFTGKEPVNENLRRIGMRGIAHERKAPRTYAKRRTFFKKVGVELIHRKPLFLS